MKKKELKHRNEILEAACISRANHITRQREEIQELQEITESLKEDRERLESKVEYLEKVYTLACETIEVFEEMQERLVNNTANCPDLLDFIETLQTEVVNL
jgi:acetyl-CoA carboxylase alpha subunit